MLVRERGHPDAEVAGLADQPDQVLGVEHALGVRHPLAHRVAGRVAAHGEDVAHAGAGQPADDVAQLGDRVVDRGQVGHRQQRRLGGDPLGHRDRGVPGRAAGAVGDRDERRAAAAPARGSPARAAARPRASWAGRTRRRTSAAGHGIRSPIAGWRAGEHRGKSESHAATLPGGHRPLPPPGTARGGKRRTASGEKDVGTGPGHVAHPRGRVRRRRAPASGGWYGASGGAGGTQAPGRRHRLSAGGSDATAARRAALGPLLARLRLRTRLESSCGSPGSCAPRRACRPVTRHEIIPLGAGGADHRATSGWAGSPLVLDMPLDELRRRRGRVAPPAERADREVSRLPPA